MCLGGSGCTPTEMWYPILGAVFCWEGLIFFIFRALVLYVYGVVFVLGLYFSLCWCSDAVCEVSGSGVLCSGISDFGEVISAFDVPFLRNNS